MFILHVLWIRTFLVIRDKVINKTKISLVSQNFLSRRCETDFLGQVFSTVFVLSGKFVFEVLYLCLYNIANSRFGGCISDGDGTLF